MRPERLEEAKGAAAAYAGTHPFMLKMRALARRGDWTPTQKQAVAILKFRGFDSAPSTPKAEAEQLKRDSKAGPAGPRFMTQARPGRDPLPRAVFSLLNEQGGFWGSAEELLDALRQRATPDEQVRLPRTPGQLAERLNSLRSSFHSWGWRWNPTVFTEDALIRLERRRKAA